MTSVNWDQTANLREQVLFGCVLLVLVFLFFRMVFSPGTAHNQVLQARVDGLQLEKTALEKFSKATPVISSQITGKSQRAVKMRILAGEIRPAFPSVTDLLAELTHPNFLGGIDVKTLDYLPPAQENGYERIDFTLKISGGFTQVIQYLGRLEQFPALFLIRDVSMNTEEGSTTVRSEMSGRFYQVLAAL